METEKFTFHGSLEQVKKLEEILEKLPSKAIVHKKDNKEHGFFDVALVGNTALIYPKYLSEELTIYSPVESVCDKESVGFSFKDNGYRIFFEKKYFGEKSKSF